MMPTNSANGTVLSASKAISDALHLKCKYNSEQRVHIGCSWQKGREIDVIINHVIINSALENQTLLEVKLLRVVLNPYSKIFK